MKEIITKRPATNSNCLDGMACPSCGSEEPFMIAVTAVATVWDDGTEEFSGVEWSSNDSCVCSHCQHEATVDDFYIDNHPHNQEENKNK